MNKKKVFEIPNDVWGTAGVNFMINSENVRIEFDCAVGEINETLVIDETGNFNVTGKYILLGGGAAQIDELQVEKNARFEGNFSAAILNLKVTEVASENILHEVVLEKGNFGKIRRAY